MQFFKFFTRWKTEKKGRQIKEEDSPSAKAGAYVDKMQCEGKNVKKQF